MSRPPLATRSLRTGHLPDPDDHWEQAASSGITALVELREQGVVGAIGAGMNQAAMLAEFVRRTDVDVVMVAGRLTLLDQSALDDLLPVAHERGIGVVAAAVYNSGLLSTATVDSRAYYDYGPAPKAVVDRALRVAEICDRHGVSLPAAAIQYPLRHPAVVGGHRNAHRGARPGYHREVQAGHPRRLVGRAPLNRFSTGSGQKSLAERPLVANIIRMLTLFRGYRRPLEQEAIEHDIEV